MIMQAPPRVQRLPVRMTRNTILRSFLVPTVLMDASNANSPFVGKKGSAKKRRREKIEKEREAAREVRHAKILASLDESTSRSRSGIQVFSLWDQLCLP